MAKKQGRKNNKKTQKKQKKERGHFVLPQETKNGISGVLMILLAVILSLAFFNKAGVAGKALMEVFSFLFGKTIFIIPLTLVLGGLVFFTTQFKRFFWPTLLAILVLILGISGILGTINGSKELGGYLGYLLSWPLLKLFGSWVAQIIFLASIVIGCLIFWQLLRRPSIKTTDKDSLPLVDKEGLETENEPSLIKKIFAPKFKVKEIESFSQPSQAQAVSEDRHETERVKEITTKSSLFAYQLPPLDLLSPEKGAPTSGDIRAISAIIKKTLQNFGILVEMSEVNIGPTVTQYTLKPAEGVKLSKITALGNNLSLALAAHPIRIEAPIPGRSLVGIEVPNKIRAQVRLRNLIETPDFQKSDSTLTLALGRDVAGKQIYTDLGKMPHLLVAGSTGSGKTIFLNTLILSLLYQNSPEILRLILIDPKRVEFPVYNNLPHLLSPVIYGANQAYNTVKWLTLEMERRFEVLSSVGARDIISYNKIMNEKIKEKIAGEQADDISDPQLMPYIVLIIDELADLMAAKGKEIEAAIVRLAQMARAVGIHLVLATQRPSVEVITGLIKANITSRITFQVASQVDSRTILDAAGAEKLLGLGDMLYLSAEVTKPRRIQGAYASEKEVKKVVNFIKSKNKALFGSQESETQESETQDRVLENGMSEDLKRSLEGPEKETGSFGWSEEESLYEEAKSVVIQAKKASASLLQRRLRIGYARAARLIDMLEEEGVVGPLQGARPREVYVQEDGLDMID
ncbi:DNA translocase FtsK [Patescibacteria group bacterium]|nr:DNA translocase FtsK [Patescibacteria group bacterium]